MVCPSARGHVQYRRGLEFVMRLFRADHLCIRLPGTFCTNQNSFRLAGGNRIHAKLLRSLPSRYVPPYI